MYEPLNKLVNHPVLKDCETAILALSVSKDGPFRYAGTK
jgi:hypothetical protein